MKTENVCLPIMLFNRGAYKISSYTKGGEATCWWWVRSPGYDQTAAAFVSDDGSVFYAGYNVDYDDDCVRPAMWIDIGE